MSEVNWSRVVGDPRGRRALTAFVEGRGIRPLITQIPSELQVEFYNMERRGVRASRRTARRILSRNR